MGTYEPHEHIALFGGLPDRGEAATDPRELADRARDERQMGDECQVCHGNGEVEVGTHRDSFGNWDTETRACECQRDDAASSRRKEASP